MATLAQIKAALKISHTSDDQELLRLRDAVELFVETYTGVSLRTTNSTQYLTWFMRTMLVQSPFSSVTSVQYYNTANVLTTMATTEYFLDRSDPPFVFLNFSNFPSIYENTQILVNYVSGTPNIPADLDQAIIGFIGGLYNSPEHLSVVSLQEVPLSAKFILDNHRSKSVLT